MQPKQFALLARQSVSSWLDDYAPSMGAAIAYYTVFSIAPLLLIVISVAGWLWGREAVQGQIVGQLAGLLGTDAAHGVEGLLASAREPAEGVISTVIGVVVLGFGATTVFAELQSALDRIWRVPAAQRRSGIVATLRARLLSFGLVLALGFLLSVSLVIGAAVSAFGHWAEGLLPAAELLLQLLNIVVSLAVSTVLFAMIFKLMPQARVGWQDVWIGAGVTAVLLEAGKVLIGLYIGKSSVASTYAAAGSAVVLLLWVYYAAQIFLLGAEFTWVYAHNHGSRRAAAGRTPPAPEVPRLSADAHPGAPPQAAAPGTLPAAGTAGTVGTVVEGHGGDGPPRVIGGRTVPAYVPRMVRAWHRMAMLAGAALAAEAVVHWAVRRAMQRGDRRARVQEAGR